MTRDLSLIGIKSLNLPLHYPFYSLLKGYLSKPRKQLQVLMQRLIQVAVVLLISLSMKCWMAEGDGLHGSYFIGTTPTGTPTVERIDPLIQFNWQQSSPHTSIPNNGFSVRWTGWIKAPATDVYTIYVKADDGVRLWINNVNVVNKWKDQGATEYSAAVNLSKDVFVPIVLEYYENGGSALCNLSWARSGAGKSVIPTAVLYSTITGDGLLGKYYVNISPFGIPEFERIDASINFNWKYGAPDSSLPADRFSVRWTGWLKAPTTGNYTFYMTGDDGIKLSLNNQKLISAWKDQAAKEYQKTVVLEADTMYPIVLEYYENTRDAKCTLSWKPEGGVKEIIPTSVLYAAHPSGTQLVIDIPAQTSVSPLGIEGPGWALEDRAYANGVEYPMYRLGAASFYANLPLAASGPTTVRIVTETTVTEKSVVWTPTELINITNKSLRKGDQLLFTTAEAGTLSISKPLGANDVFAMQAADLLAYEFPSAGIYNLSFSSISGTYAAIIEAIDMVIPTDSLAVQIGYERPYKLATSPAGAQISIESSDALYASISNDGEIAGEYQLHIQAEAPFYSAIVVRTATGSIVGTIPIAAFVADYNGKFGLFDYDTTTKTGVGSVFIRPWVKNLDTIFKMHTSSTTFEAGQRTMTINTNDFEPGPYPDSGMFVYTIYNVEPSSVACHFVSFDQPGNTIVGQSGLLNPGHVKVPGEDDLVCGGSRSCSWNEDTILTKKSIFKYLPLDEFYSSRISKEVHFDITAISDTSPPIELDRGDIKTLDSRSTAQQIAPTVAIARWKDSTFNGADDLLGEIKVTQNDGNVPDNKNSIAFIFGNANGSYYPTYLDWYLKWEFVDLGITTFNKEPFRIKARESFSEIPPRFLTFTNAKETEFFDVTNPDGDVTWILPRGIFVVFDKRNVVLSGNILTPSMLLVVNDPMQLTEDEELIRATALSDGITVEVIGTAQVPAKAPTLVVISATATNCDVLQFADHPIISMLGKKYQDLHLAHRPGRIITNQNVELFDTNHYITQFMSEGKYVSSTPVEMNSLNDPLGDGLGDVLLGAEPTDYRNVLMTTTRHGLRAYDNEVLLQNRIFIGIPISANNFGIDTVSLFRRSFRWAMQTSTIHAKSPTEINQGGLTLRIEISRDSFKAEVGNAGSLTNKLLAGITSSGNEVSGWNAIITPLLNANHVTRINDQTLEITIPANQDYHLQEPESITVSIDEQILQTSNLFPEKLEYQIISEAIITISPDGEGQNGMPLPTGITRSNYVPKKSDGTVVDKK